MSGMTVKEIREYLNRLVKHSPDVDDWTVQILLNEPSIGAKASVPIESMCRGFDWEYGKVLAFTDEPIVRENNKLWKNKLWKSYEE